MHQSESDALTKDRNDERLRNVTGRPDDWRYSLIIPHQTISLAKTNGDHTLQKGLVMTMTATKLAFECVRKLYQDTRAWASEDND